MRFDQQRADWVQKYPVKGPSFHWNNITHISIHYTADDDLIDGDPGESWDKLDDYIAAIQKNYTEKRGYSIGYNAAVDQRGVTWELRGDTFQCAANKGWNEVTFAILVLVDGADPLTDNGLNGVRDLVKQIRDIRPGIPIVGHRDIGSTSCPGNGVYHQIKSGLLEPQAWLPPTIPGIPEIPNLPPISEDNKMNTVIMWKDKRYHDIFQVYPSVAPVASGVIEAMQAEGLDVKVIEGKHHQVLKALAKMTSKDVVLNLNWTPVAVSTLPDSAS